MGYRGGPETAEADVIKRRWLKKKKKKRQFQNMLAGEAER